MIDWKVLDAIPPDCGYDEWLKVGMALKHEGASLDIWDRWSSAGSKYKPGECAKKWKSFNRSEVTGGTLLHIAAQYGYEPERYETREYDLHNLLLDEIVVDPSFTSGEAVPKPAQNYDPRGEMLEYFETLFNPDDFVGYCVSFRQDPKDGKWKPAQTVYRRTAGDIIQKLKDGMPIDRALGTLNQFAGAYVRFNPLDGKGENNSNVTRWKYCLIESDEDSLEKQYGVLKAMNLPITFLINSGGKSLHAITRVDAENEGQYRERVRELYEFCKKNGLNLDEQDKNSSRFSRLPGIQRGENWQYIVARNIGAESYAAWIDWREGQADDLPPDISLLSVWNDMPPLKEELIPGVLRVGHKMLLAGPSKAGKSFLLINLAISIAEGCDWIGMQCRQGRVCYVNLELDSASCFKRFKEAYEKKHIAPDHIGDIDIWNLRGHAVPMNKLAPVMIHRFKERKYAAVISDPIYKVITGDENNATEMSQFCSYFDQVATEMGVSVIYCHHHSKGASGKYANAADRSSGSGVFARDPDAILDLRELNEDGLTDKYREGHDDACEVLTGWEMSGTLREFAPMADVRLWFDYPLHVPDTLNLLGAASYSDSGSSGAGVGSGQKSKQDYYEMVEELLEFSQDTAVSLEAVGISESNAQNKFGVKSNYEIATLDGTKAVHRRIEDMIIFGGEKYYRKAFGNRSKWVKNPQSQSQTP
jgi:RecA-family ATPase